MTDPVPTILVGGPLRDAAEPSHGVEPHRCTVCGTADGLRLLPYVGAPRRICRPCFDAVMHRIGVPSHPGAVLTCSARTAHGPNQFGHNDRQVAVAAPVVAIWPTHTVLSIGTPSIRACSHHLDEAIAAEVLDRATTASETQP